MTALCRALRHVLGTLQLFLATQRGKNLAKLLILLAPRPGLEPGTYGLTERIIHPKLLIHIGLQLPDGRKRHRFTAQLGHSGGQS